MDRRLWIIVTFALLGSAFSAPVAYDTELDQPPRRESTPEILDLEEQLKKQAGEDKKFMPKESNPLPQIDGLADDDTKEQQAAALASMIESQKKEEPNADTVPNEDLVETAEASVEPDEAPDKQDEALAEPTPIEPEEALIGQEEAPVEQDEAPVEQDEAPVEQDETRGELDETPLESEETLVEQKEVPLEPEEFRIDDPEPEDPTAVNNIAEEEQNDEDAVPNPNYEDMFYESLIQSVKSNPGAWEKLLKEHQKLLQEEKNYQHQMELGARDQDSYPERAQSPLDIQRALAMQQLKQQQMQQLQQQQQHQQQQQQQLKQRPWFYPEASNPISSPEIEEQYARQGVVPQEDWQYFLGDTLAREVAKKRGFSPPEAAPAYDDAQDQDEDRLQQRSFVMM